MLGQDCILGGFGAVVSLPGASDQHEHRDHTPLFGSAIDRQLPCVAITVITPLVDMNETTGTTRVYTASHTLAGHPSADSAEEPSVRVGSSLLMDYRLMHGGTANRSQLERPVLYSVYSRPWFRDVNNSTKHPLLQLSAEEYQHIPAAHRSLFSGITIEPRPAASSSTTPV